MIEVDPGGAVSAGASIARVFPAPVGRFTSSVPPGGSTIALRTAAR